MRLIPAQASFDSLHTIIYTHCAQHYDNLPSPISRFTTATVMEKVMIKVNLKSKLKVEGHLSFLCVWSRLHNGLFHITPKCNRTFINDEKVMGRWVGRG